MNAFPIERDIRVTVKLLIDRYGIDQALLKRFLGNQNYNKLNQMVIELEEKRIDDYKLARLIVVNKGPYLFAGSNDAVRELRASLLGNLDEDKLIELYERNPIKGRNLNSPSYIRNALAQKKWVMGGKWARDFIQTLGLPLVFSGLSIPKNHNTDPFQDIEPRRSLPPLVDYQLELKEKMLRVLSEEEDRTRCVVTLPTGGGKTRVAVESFIDWMQPRFSEGKYLLWIAQGEELCEQAISCMIDMWQDREFTEALRINQVIRYEKSNGRTNIRQHNNLGLVDFSSERFNGEQRFIILTTDSNSLIKELNTEDLHEIREMVYIYVVQDEEIKKEKPLVELENDMIVD